MFRIGNAIFIKSWVDILKIYETKQNKEKIVFRWTFIPAKAGIGITKTEKSSKNHSDGKIFRRISEFVALFCKKSRRMVFIHSCTSFVLRSKMNKCRD